MTKLSEDDIYNCVGTTGGVILACALIPQIVLAHKRRSAEDISYMWQVRKCVFLTFKLHPVCAEHVPVFFCSLHRLLLV